MKARVSISGIVFSLIFLFVFAFLLVNYIVYSSQSDNGELLKVSHVNLEYQPVNFRVSAEPYVIITGEYPPYISEQLPEYGVYYQIVKKVLDQMDINYSIKFYPWNRGLHSVDIGDAWSSFPYMPTKERQEKYLFTDALNEEGVDSFVMFYYEPNHDYSYMKDKMASDFTTFQIGGLTNYFYVNAFELANIKLDLSDDEIDVFKKLIAGRIDFVPSDIYVANYIINTYYPDEKDNIKHVSIQFESMVQKEQYRLILSKQNIGAEKFISLFNQKLKEFKTTKEYLDFIKDFK